jgi:hypothetical protein
VFQGLQALGKQHGIRFINWGHGEVVAGFDNSYNAL